MKKKNLSIILPIVIVTAFLTFEVEVTKELSGQILNALTAYSF